MTKKVRKILSMIVIFVLTVVNYGFPLKAMAAEGASFFNFFKKDEIELKAYFDGDENKNETNADVNDVVDVTIEITPLVEEYLKDGVLRFGLKNGNVNNFKIQSIRVEEEVSEVEEDENTDEPNIVENTISTEVKTEEGENVITPENVIEESVEKNHIGSSLEDDVITEEILDEMVIENSNEEVVVQNYEVKLVSDTEIELKNIINKTKIHVEIVFNSDATINIEDLYSEIEVVLNGNYVDEDLEIIEVSRTQDLTLGWEYSKDIVISSDYTKVSPFVVGEIKGTILENVVTINREITEANFLPIKNTNLEIQIPRINGELPIGISVTSNKLMATLGTGLTDTEFSEENWTYDESTGILNINIENTNLALGNGEDRFDIICRYEEYIEDETVTLDKNVKVIVEEYSSNSNNVQEKMIEEVQDKEVKSGELMSCSAVENNEVINKGKINANYYISAGYETEFKDVVNLTILTSDILEDITLESSKENYIDKDGNELDASSDVKYKGINFNYNEIKEMLENGSTIEILDENDNVLHTITNEDNNYSIVFENKIDNLKVRINKVMVNKNLSIEFVKTIDNSSYSVETFNTIQKLESSMDVKVKYVGFEETFKISEITNENILENTQTDVSFFMNTTNLSAISENQNVEFRIEFMNNEVTSDLYRNPTFEIVFPKYVEDVTINSVNLLYKNGLSMLDSKVVYENGYVKIRINLEGTQSEFNFSNITNGTNILLDTNIVVDELTPSIQDAIKLYYYNEIATDYNKEINWSMSKDMPANVTTHGYDYVYINYQTLSGFVTSNGISNFDSIGSQINTVKQGKVTANLDMGVGTRVVTMNLATVNNTGNACSDVVMIGRIPSEGTTDVITGEKLQTNTNTKMVSGVRAAEENNVKCDIYYSYKADANKNLDDASNGWTKEPEDMSNVKSFLIVPVYTVSAGAVLKFSYDFEVPANLPYDVEMYGNFGAYYNNHLSYETMYESSQADLVALVTDAGPRLEASLSVDVGDGEKVNSLSRLKYTVKVENTGSILAENVVVNIPVPENCVVVEKQVNLSLGDYGFEEKTTRKNVTFNLEKIEPGESKELTFYLRVGLKRTLDAYAAGKDENGYYLLRESAENGKEYITDVPAMYVKVQATVSSSIMAEEILTNEVVNEVEATMFDLTTYIDYDRSLNPGTETNFRLVFKNVSGKVLEDVQVVLDIGDVYSYSEGNVEDVYETLVDSEITVDAEAGKIYFPIGTMDVSETMIVKAKVIAKTIAQMELSDTCHFEVIAKGMETAEQGTVITQKIEIPWIEAEDITSGVPGTINEGDQVTVSLRIKNNSNRNVTSASFECDIPNCLEVVDVKSADGKLMTAAVQDGKVINKLPVILEGEQYDVYLTVRAKNLPGVDSTIAVLNMVAKNDGQADISVSAVEFNILNTEKTEDEIIAENNAAFEEAESEYIAQAGQTENDNTNVNNQNGTDAVQNDTNTSTSNEGTTNTEVNNTETNSTTQNNQTTTENNTTVKEETVVEEVKTYNITGMVWLDENKNGIRDNSEKGIESIEVLLLDSNNKVLKTVKTSSTGKYTFDKLENSKYAIGFKYDTDTYVISTYMKSNVSEERNSDAIAIESDKMNAITNEMHVNGAHISNIDLGLQNKEIFDLQVGKYISKITVTTKKGTTTYEYDNEEIAKVDIHSKQLAGAKVDLEYTVVVENTGSLDGYAEQIKDYLSKDVEFDETKNTNWYKGTDGNVYVKDSNQVTLKPGEKKEYKLYVTKTMTEENTGVLSNKIEIVKAVTTDNEQEINDNNTSVQNTIITVSTGKTVQIVIITICVVGIVIVVLNRKKISLDFSKVYKTKEKKKTKINLKKNYK